MHGVGALALRKSHQQREGWPVRNWRAGCAGARPAIFSDCPTRSEEHRLCLSTAVCWNVTKNMAPIRQIVPEQQQHSASKETADLQHDESPGLSSRKLNKIVTKMTHNDSRFLSSRLSLRDLDFRFLGREHKIETMTQAQSIYLITNDGEFIFLQLAYTTVGLKPLCQVSARYFRSEHLTSSEFSKSSSNTLLDQSHPPSPEAVLDFEKIKAHSSSSLLSSIVRHRRTASAKHENLTYASPDINKWCTDNCSASDWKRKPDHVSCEVGSIYASQLSADGKELNLAFEKTKELSLQLSMKTQTGVVQLKDGVLSFEKPNGDSIGFMQFRFAPYLKFTGTVGYGHDKNGNLLQKELQGHGLIAHITQALKPHLAASFWSFCSFQTIDNDEGATAHSKSSGHVHGKEQIALMMSHLGTPAAYGSSSFNQGILVMNGETIAVSINNKLSLEHNQIDSASGYKIPRLIIYEWEGTSMHGKLWKARISQIPTILIDKIDLLAQLPFIFRKFIQVFYSKPFCYQWLDDAILELSIDNQPTVTTCGKLFHELSILNECTLTSSRKL